MPLAPSPEFIGLLAISVLIAGAINGIAGFGFAIVGTMALATVIDPATAVVFMIIPILSVNLSLVRALSATEVELEEADREQAVGRASFPGSIMGRVKRFEHGFAQALADPASGEILGFHVLGYEASTLIHEVVPVMRMSGTVSDIADAIFAHPSLSKITRSAFQDVSR